MAFGIHTKIEKEYVAKYSPVQVGQEIEGKTVRLVKVATAVKFLYSFDGVDFKTISITLKQKRNENHVR